MVAFTWDVKTVWKSIDCPGVIWQVWLTEQIDELIDVGSCAPFKPIVEKPANNFY